MKSFSSVSRIIGEDWKFLRFAGNCGSKAYTAEALLAPLGARLPRPSIGIAHGRVPFGLGGIEGPPCSLFARFFGGGEDLVQAEEADNQEDDERNTEEKLIEAFAELS